MPSSPPSTHSPTIMLQEAASVSLSSSPSFSSAAGSSPATVCEHLALEIHHGNTLPQSPKVNWPTKLQENSESGGVIGKILKKVSMAMSREPTGFARSITAPVRKPKGNWVHAGYHLTSGITGPQVLNLPFAIAAMGWGPGLFILCLGGVVSFYAYYLQIRLMEHVTKQTGRPCERFRDLSAHVLGEKWTSCLIAPLQFIVCFATVVACILLGGQTLKAIFNGQELSLYQFTIVFGCLHMVLSQLPSMHSLRHLNLISTIASVSYCGLIAYGALFAGISKDAPKKDYAINGTNAEKLFTVFNSLSILSNIYGSVIVVEIQATIKEPTSKNMIKGLCLCYTVILLTILPVAVFGYWSFGSVSNANILMNIFPQEASIHHHVPSWVCILVNILIFLQLVVSSLMYSQPTFAVLEEPTTLVNQSAPTYRSLISRLLSRAIFTVFATLFAAMLPYFGSINALIGALGYTPLVFVVPIILYLRTFEPLVLCTKQCMQYVMVALFSIIAALGCLASLRQLVLDAKMYHLFANL